jgi:ribulose-5-phosphate 4-epimerase/fuculose-1-phosphate aldolase
MFSEVTASSLIATTFDGERVGSGDELVNFGGVVIHGGVYRGAPHVNCVVHLHTTANVAVSAQRRGLLPISQYALVLTDKVAYHDYEGLAIKFDERQRMIANLGDKRVMVLRNHGSLVCTDSIVSAHEYTYAYERACQIQVAALGAGNEELIPCSDGLGQLTASQFDYEPKMALLSWDAVIRRVHARSPGFDT